MCNHSSVIEVSARHKDLFSCKFPNGFTRHGYGFLWELGDDDTLRIKICLDCGTLVDVDLENLRDQAEQYAMLEEADHLLEELKKDFSDQLSDDEVSFVNETFRLIRDGEDELTQDEYEWVRSIYNRIIVGE